MGKSTESRRQRQDRILESASNVFANNDYADGAIEDVAKGANVARGTVYNHFGTKDQLYREVLASRLDKLISRLSEVIETDGEPVRNLSRCVVQPFLFFVKYPNLLLIWKREDLRRHSSKGGNGVNGSGSEMLSRQVSSARDDLFEIIHGVVSNGVLEGVFRKVEERVVTSILLGAIESAAGSVFGEKINSAAVQVAKEGLGAFVLSSLIMDESRGAV